MYAVKRNGSSQNVRTFFERTPNPKKRQKLNLPLYAIGELSKNKAKKKMTHKRFFVVVVHIYISVWCCLLLCCVEQKTRRLLCYYRDKFSTFLWWKLYKYRYIDIESEKLKFGMIISTETNSNGLV